MNDTTINARPAWTPGPWQLGGTANGYQRKIWPPTDRTGGYMIMIADCDSHGARTSVQDDANTRLIAAAPALYEALQALIEATAAYADLTTADAATARKIAKRQARVALAAADGRDGK